MAAVTWSVIKVIIPIFIIYRSAEPMVSYLLIYCHSPSLLETKFPITICLKRLASRQNMQTQLDTKSSCVASGLPALVVMVCLLYCMFGYLAYSEISVWDEKSEVQLLHTSSLLYCMYVCLSATRSTPLFFTFFSVFISFTSLYPQKCGDLSSSSPPPLCLCSCVCFKTDN